MCKIDRVISRCNSLIEELYYTGREITSNEYYVKSQKVERMLQYLREELKVSPLARKRKDKIETLIYIW